jgi:hypothetical protein
LVAAGFCAAEMELVLEGFGLVSLGSTPLALWQMDFVLDVLDE